jgi:RimJ/RimL family protein N-acetyltransferase
LRDFHGEEVLNLGYRFRPEVWGRGYAVEAARGVLSWHAGTRPRLPVLATIDVANRSSLRVAERIGFREYTEEVHLGAPARHYRL